MDKVDFSRNFDNPSNLGALINAQLLGDSKKAKKQKTPAIRPSAVNFSDVLENSLLDIGELGPLREFQPSEEALQELLDSVRGAGDDLKKRPFPGEILKYRQSVRDFLHYVVENGYELKEFQGIKRKTVFRGETEWKTAVYHQVRVVDQTLDQLAADILSKHISELDLKSRIDQVTGLLVDLTVTGKIRERYE